MLKDKENKDRQNMPKIGQLRECVVGKILELSPQKCDLTREVQFLAVSILDSYIYEEEYKENYDQEQNFSLDEATTVAISCLKLAQKLQGDTRVRIGEFQKLYGWKGSYDELKKECAEIESKICEKIDFFLPLETCYNYLDKSMNVHPTQDHLLICRVLQVLLAGLRYSIELSENPEYGSRIYERIVFEKKDPQIKKYLKRMKRWYQSKA